MILLQLPFIPLLQLSWCDMGLSNNSALTCYLTGVPLEVCVHRLKFPLKLHFNVSSHSSVRVVHMVHMFLHESCLTSIKVKVF